MQDWLHKWGAINAAGFVQAGADILIVAYLSYRLMMLAKGTRAWQIIWGILVFGTILWFSSVAQLVALNWIIKQMFGLGLIAIVILFLPELRHALEEVGRLGFWGRGFVALNKEDLTQLMSEIVRAAESLSQKKQGALIVMERETGLSDIIETGTLVNATVSADLLCTLFYPGSPLHDGAVIIRRDRVIAAGCTLPLTQSRNIGVQVHTRHKAALGISEQSDAVVVVVSEETGIISVAFEGRMLRHLRDDKLRDYLIGMFQGRERPLLRRRGGKKTPNVPSSVPASVVKPVEPKESSETRTVEPFPTEAR